MYSADPQLSHRLAHLPEPQIGHHRRKKGQCYYGGKTKCTGFEFAPLNKQGMRRRFVQQHGRPFLFIEAHPKYTEIVSPQQYRFYWH
jgi:hypothetical protein